MIFQDHYFSIVAVVTGCGILEDFYKKEVEPYLNIKSVDGPTREPKGTDIVQAYMDFMNDKNNMVAQKFLKLFPGQD